MPWSRTKSSKKWSAKVTQRSNALDLERDDFKWEDPRKIAKLWRAQLEL